MKVIFKVYIFSWIFKMSELRENIYNAKNIYVHSNVCVIIVDVGGLASEVEPV